MQTHHQIIFYTRTPPPPNSTLFPYTTLFRSKSKLRFELFQVAADFTEPIALVVRQRVQDRKSTRLNSSHITTSYAVFCLKKKRIVSFGWRPSTPRVCSNKAALRNCRNISPR